MPSLNYKNKNMKKIFSTLAVIALVMTTVQAQNPSRRIHKMRQGNHPDIQKQLNLTEDQKMKYKSLNEDFRKNMMDLRKKDDITVKEWRTRMSDLQKKHRMDMQSVLSPDQKNRIEKMKADRKQIAEIDARARMEKMKIQLGLSNDQMDKLKNQRMEMMNNMKAMRENGSIDMMKKREEMKAMMEKRKAEMKSILTDEQRKKMMELRMRHPRKPGKLS